jgi:soluble lytic murein transglycosylase
VIAFALAAGLMAGGSPAAPSAAVAHLNKGFAAYRAGDYHGAAEQLRGAIGKGLRNEGWALFLLGESEFYDGDYRAARGRFERLLRGHKGRPADMAPFRIADCQWMEGDRAAAATGYGKLLKKAGPRSGDVVLARFRIAEAAAARNPAAAKPQWMALGREFPAHPLADEALRRIGAGAAPAAAPAATPQAPATPSADLPPADRLRRAESLSKDRHWDEALAELAKLPATLPPEVAAERDYQIGMTKFHMRRDYAAAGELLLAAVPRLSGDKAASAQFHGARALSRVDRDDEAIAGYRQTVAKFPRSRWAAEAQYLSGWLDYNRGRFKDSLPALQATLDKFGGSAFADDAAWCVAFAHFLLGNGAEAAAGLDRYGRLPPTGIASDEIAARVAYWRARLAEKTGRKDDAENGYRQIAQRAPLSYYGLLSRARLKQAGKEEPLRLPARKIPSAPPAHPEREPLLATANELLDAGMDVEAGLEIEAREKDVLKRMGGDKALPWLLGYYQRAGNFRRAFRLADAKDDGALNADPHADAGTRAFWEAAFPKAYAPLVEKYGPPAGNPELYLYTIMKKESGFNPHDVSYADARGLLQMIPPTSVKVAALAGEPFAPDLLYDPETNIRLGAFYIGSLYAKFGKEIALTAGAYNAGPKAMGRWCTQHGAHPTDEFIELVAFAQTREYIKRVVSLYAKYRFLYGPKPYEIALTLDTKVAPGGPDY